MAARLGPQRQHFVGQTGESRNRGAGTSTHAFPQEPVRNAGAGSGAVGGSSSRRMAPVRPKVVGKNIELRIRTDNQIAHYEEYARQNQMKAHVCEFSNKVPKHRLNLSQPRSNPGVEEELEALSYGRKLERSAHLKSLLEEEQAQYEMELAAMGLAIHKDTL